MTQSTPEKPKKSPVVVVLIVVAAIAALAVPAIGIMSVLAIYGVRRYLVQAKSAEGRSGVTSLAMGVARCAEAGGKLPPTSHRVPASLSSVSGVKYVAASSEWSGDPAFSCAGFSMSTPQYFQYQWEKLSETTGVARAIADLDGDGTADASFEAEVVCAPGGACHASPPKGK